MADADLRGAVPAAEGPGARHLPLHGAHRSAGLPSHDYPDLRQRRARELMLQTEASVTRVTVPCGFQSASHFCKRDRPLFGKPPSCERRPTSERAVAANHPEKPVTHRSAPTG